MKYTLLLLLSITIFTSCQTDNLDSEYVVGTDYLSSSSDVTLIDTLTVNVSTINLDSLATSSQSRILLGNYTDPVFGEVNSDSYMQLVPGTYTIGDSSSDTNTDNYVFDSIVMILKYDRYYYGDTTQTQSINIYQLSEKVDTNDADDDNFYNYSTLSYNTTSLGSKTYTTRPIGKDSIFVRLDDTFGEALFDKLKSNDISTYDEFIYYFKGLMIKPSSGSNVIGFSTDTSLMRLYYTNTSDPLHDFEDSSTKDFTITDTGLQFNNITLDRTGTVISDVSYDDYESTLSSTLTGNKSYVQSGTGMACRIDFPYIKLLKSISDNGLIVDAELSIKPVAGSYSTLYPLKDSLKVYICDDLNRISSALTNSSGTQMYAILNDCLL
jgi:hypothetical protein